MSPETPHDFQQRAANCERLAAKSKDPQVRKNFLYVASKWRELAAHPPNVVRPSPHRASAWPDDPDIDGALPGG